MLYNITITTKAGVLFRQYLRKDYKSVIIIINREDNKPHDIDVECCIKREVLDEFLS